MVEKGAHYSILTANKGIFSYAPPVFAISLPLLMFCWFDGILHPVLHPIFVYMRPPLPCFSKQKFIDLFPICAIFLQF